MSHTAVFEIPDKIRLNVIKPKSGIKARFIAYSSDTLRNLRKEFQVSQKELAQVLGLTQGRISHFESEGHDEKPSIDQLADIGKLFSEKAGYKIILYPDHSYGKGPQEFWGA